MSTENPTNTEEPIKTEEPKPSKPSSLRFLTPLIIFAVIAGFLYKGLYMDPHEIPSVLINKPAPQFTLPRLDDPSKTISTADLKGKVWLFNVWASWCVSCRAEHEVLVSLSRMGVVDIYGLNYKDTQDAAQAWLNRLGNPYVTNAVDADGRVGIDWGVYGVPETFVVDKKGIIRHKHTGPVTHESLREQLLPIVEKLKAES